MRILGTVAVCFVGVIIWSASYAAVSANPQAEPRAAQAAPAADLYQDVYNGWKWWHVYCYRCHGTDAVGTTTAPSLIDANEKLSRAAFIKIVREGVKDKGMAAWDKLLDAKQMGQLYVYVRARADKVLPPGRPDEVGPNKGKWEPADWTPK
jgi:mono/diheme cytochrome c family protein